MTNKEFVVHPIVSPVQKIILYRTKSHFYLVGSNNTQSKFRVLKIDRTEPKELNVIDDKVEYNKREIKDLLSMIESGNRSKQGQRFVSDLNRTISSFGIVGFVRFLEGYYVILITKRKRVAIIGHHTIFKIQDTCMVYIPNDGDKSSHPHESKYLKLFQSMDLSSNFYFSYSYDISHTLQYNLASLNELSSLNASQDAEQAKSIPFWNPQLNTIEGNSEEVAVNFLESLQGNDTPDEKSGCLGSKLSSSCYSESDMWSELRSNADFSPASKESAAVHYGIKTKPNFRFVWNSYLLEPVDLHSDWLLYITHGFVGQFNISVYGRPIYLTLIARRSQKFAGTRFLKRGANDKGDVANEVETEQIVYDSSVSSLTLGRFTSFVQLRGSIPSQWSQDISKIVPKPPIILDNADPFYFGAGQHFNDLLSRYGCPIVVLNLVKKREQKRHESILSEQFYEAVEYLNQFLPPSQHIIHIGFDMAHMNKLKEASVMSRLAKIAYYVISKTGFFHNQPEYFCQKIHSTKKFIGGYQMENSGRIQTGVVRVNCVDCLDRTNTAQFALGKAALAFQLYALGVVESPELEFDSDTVRMLEELYEDHGDTLALQYGGSQLVHRVKTYRKIAPLSYHSRDIMQTLSRYYSNTFSDADKQNAINLFLGVFEPSRWKTALWDLLTDYYLHNSVAAGKLLCHRNLYTCWWDEGVKNALPLSYIEVTGVAMSILILKNRNEHVSQLVSLRTNNRWRHLSFILSVISVKKEIDGSVLEIIKTHPLDPRIDGFFDHYRPFELTTITDLLPFSMTHSVRDVMPNFSTDYSPFSVRVRPGKKRESIGEKPPNPSVTGISSTASASSGTSETDSGESSNDDDFVFLSNEETSSSCSSPQPVTFPSLFPTMKQVYGMEPQRPSAKDMKIYERFVETAKFADMYEDAEFLKGRQSFSFKKNGFSSDSAISVTPPTVKKRDLEIYEAYVESGLTGPKTPSRKSLEIYRAYSVRQFQ